MQQSAEYITDRSTVTLIQPGYLFLLILPLSVLALMIVSQKQRSTYAVRLSSTQLFDSLVPSSPTSSRLVASVPLICGLVLGSIGLAEPAIERERERRSGLVVLALDVSLSMGATDIAPSRIGSAQAASVTFVERMPQAIDVALVSFSGTVTVEAPFGSSRREVVEALDRLQLDESTAIGDAINKSLDLLESAAPNGAVRDSAIVVISDGDTTVGASEDDAASRAAAIGVNIYTVSIGTPSGEIEFDNPETAAIDPQIFPVPVDEGSLQGVATATGGDFYAASQADQLFEIHEQIGTVIGTELILESLMKEFLLVTFALIGLHALLVARSFRRLT